jgi:hypothetical protein
LNRDEKIEIVQFASIIILALSIAAIIAWPQNVPDKAMTYRGWVIYSPDDTATVDVYVAVRDGYTPITENNLSDIKARINFTLDGNAGD